MKYPNVIVVLGNHDYYKASPSEVHEAMLRVTAKHRNLHWLENGTVRIDGVRFVGTTLWFKENSNPTLSSWMTDFQVIRQFEPWVYLQNEASVHFLHETVQPDDVVITHHLPSFMSVSPKYAGHPLNAFFVSDVESVIQKGKPQLWIHGHTHESVDYHIGATRVLCNPFGYARQEENRKFNDHLIVEVSHAGGSTLP